VLSASLALAAALPLHADDSKVLRIITWASYVPSEVIAQFRKETGIEVQVTLSNNEEMISKLRATGGAGFDLAGPERRHHIRRRAKIGHFDVEAFVAEIALLVRDEDRCVARAAGRPNRYRLRGCCAGWHRQSVQEYAYDEPERRLPQARFSLAIECSQFTNIRMREQLRGRPDRRKFRACSFDRVVRRQASRKGLRTPPSGSSAKMA